MDNLWEEHFKIEEKKEYFSKLMKCVDNEYDNKNIFPDRDMIFRAFELTPFNSVKCVIIGQDPYFNSGEAHGLAFSVPDGVKIPPSLRNIYKELNDDLKIDRINGNLTGWANEGVLLLNRVLTVEEGKPNSHKKLGWMEFTKNTIIKLAQNENPIVFLLWGAEAGKLEKYIGPANLVLKAPHPSPLSSYRGFFGCKHFSMCNNYLMEHLKSKIDWGRY